MTRPFYNAVLALADGSVFHGFGIGAHGTTVGEICFNTSMTGYQEILTDPSYAGQIINFTFPHIGNVGTNAEDIECNKTYAKGLVIHQAITPPSNYRAKNHFEDWLTKNNLIGIYGVDTRRLTRHIRHHGAQNCAIAHIPDGSIDAGQLVQIAKDHLNMDGLDLAIDVTCKKPYHWTESMWSLENGYGQAKNPQFKVVAIDYGIKRNILRSLVTAGCDVTVVPATTPAKKILAMKPDGIFLSNGPGDPYATGQYAVPIIQELMKSGLPLFGICLGHQLLGLALGGKTAKMLIGHRGANHPVKNLITGHVEITSQNHGFMVLLDSLPDSVEQTHSSLFDNSSEGLALKGQPVFSVQYHPEASPGPMDSHYLFEQFVDLMKKHRQSHAA